MEIEKAIRVFVSHSSHDKARFVEPFALRLRERGIDAWLDKWEMLPGDSLVDKIFEEGLKDAAAFVIVLSQASVSSEWVRKELNTATVHSIEKGTKLIPIVLDDCEIPACLKDKVYERISDLYAYDAEFVRIAASIESRVLKPALGTPPNYVSRSFPQVPGLEHQDIAVLKELGDCVLRKNREVYDIVQHDEIQQIRTGLGLTVQQLQESLTILEEMNITQPSRTLSLAIEWAQLSQFGFRIYLNAFYPQFASELSEILLAIVNASLTGDAEISANTKTPILIVRFVLKELEQRGLLRLAEWNSGCELHSLSPKLKRMLQNGESLI
jgi:hypothetical protein